MNGELNGHKLRQAAEALIRQLDRPMNDFERWSINQELSAIEKVLNERASNCSQENSHRDPAKRRTVKLDKLNFCLRCGRAVLKIIVAIQIVEGLAPTRRAIYPSKYGVNGFRISGRSDFD